jgi:hypothetical protein
MKRIILIFTLLFLKFVDVKSQEVSYNYCETVQKIGDASSSLEIYNLIDKYIDNTLNVHYDQFNTPQYGPLYGSKAREYKSKIQSKLKIKEQNLNELRVTAVEILDFFSILNEACEIDYTQDPSVRYFKMLQKVVELAKDLSFINSPAFFVLEITKIYLEVGIEILKIIKKIGDYYITSIIDVEAPGGFIVYIRLINGKGVFNHNIDPEAYIGKIDVEIVNIEGGVIKADIVSKYNIHGMGNIQSDKGPTISETQSIKVFVSQESFSQIACQGCDYAVRIKINPNEDGVSQNIIYIPIDARLSYKWGGTATFSIYYKLYLTSGSPSINEYSRFKLQK